MKRMFCMLCSEEIREGQDYFETWFPMHQVHCRPCHEMWKQKKVKA